MIVTLTVVATLLIIGSGRMLYVAGYRRGVEAERARAARIGAALRTMTANRRDEYGQTVVELVNDRN